MRYFIAIFVFTIVAVISVAGFRGRKSSEPPLYIFPDMNVQTKFFAQGESEFQGFSDHRDDRPVPDHTVQRGYGWAIAETFSPQYGYAPAKNPALYSGRNPDGTFYKGFPVHVTSDFIELGRQKFNINCAVCHGQTGDGNGITKIGYGMGTVRPLIENPYMTSKTEGEIFTTITYGSKTMGPYGDRLAPSERWAIVAYVRALQLAGGATPDDVDPQYKAKLGL